MISGSWWWPWRTVPILTSSEATPDALTAQLETSLYLPGVASRWSGTSLFRFKATVQGEVSAGELYLYVNRWGLRNFLRRRFSGRVLETPDGGSAMEGELACATLPKIFTGVWGGLVLLAFLGMMLNLVIAMISNDAVRARHALIPLGFMAQFFVLVGPVFGLLLWLTRADDALLLDWLVEQAITAEGPTRGWPHRRS